VVARLLALGLVVLAAGCAGGSDPGLTLPPGASFTATGTMTPRTIGFGDQLTARLRILVDRDRIDPEKIRVLARFSPWRDRTTVERIDDGDITALTYTITLDCLTVSCVPSDRESRAFFSNARIVSGEGPVQEVEWPPVGMITRVPPQDPFAQPAENTGEELEQWPPAWRAAVAVPEPSYRASPALLTWILAGLGGLLVAGSLVAALLLLSRGRLVRARVVPPLDRALELLRNARTPEERRAALEALALALDPELADPARALAWSESTPSEADAEQLAALAKGGAR
jgi:hypothetical protein